MHDAAVARHPTRAKLNAAESARAVAVTVRHLARSCLITTLLGHRGSYHIRDL